MCSKGQVPRGLQEKRGHGRQPMTEESSLPEEENVAWG